MDFNLRVASLITALLLSFSQTFSQNGGVSVPPAPDYSQFQNWASHPLIRDSGDSIPRPLKNQYSYDSTIDVFFIHPTTYLRKENNQMNADVSDEYLNERTDQRTILNQASVFNEFRLFAPRYRQANYSAYLNILGDSKPYFDIAYADIKKAFEYYLAHWNRGHPFFIAAHSQGSQHAARLISELIEGTALEKKLIAAYLIGMPPVKTPMLKTPVCKDSTQTGCYVAWNSFTEDFRPEFSFGKIELRTVNPLTWNDTEKAGTKAMHRGAVIENINTVRTQVLSAKIQSERLIVSSPSMDLPSRMGNLHTLDINLFYVDIRHNLRTRSSAYKKKI